ncbi:MAG: hypothetical protein AVDCRST_MAG64-2020, partial [uncultured Phycisphaerae bacterium]
AADLSLGHVRVERRVARVVARARARRHPAHGSGVHGLRAEPPHAHPAALRRRAGDVDGLLGRVAPDPARARLRQRADEPRGPAGVAHAADPLFRRVRGPRGRRPPGPADATDRCARQQPRRRAL